jgi:hypothetical protein
MLRVSHDNENQCQFQCQCQTADFLAFEGILDFAHSFDHPLILITSDDFSHSDSFTNYSGENSILFSPTLLHPISPRFRSKTAIWAQKYRELERRSGNFCPDEYP